MDAESVWLVDPIDGTKSFVRECPFFSTQIALMRGGQVRVRRVDARRPTTSWPGPSAARARFSTASRCASARSSALDGGHRVHRQSQDAGGVAGVGALRRADRRRQPHPRLWRFRALPPAGARRARRGDRIGREHSRHRGAHRHRRRGRRPVHGSRRRGRWVSTPPRCSPPTARCTSPCSTTCASGAEPCRCSCAGEYSEFSAWRRCCMRTTPASAWRRRMPRRRRRGQRTGRRSSRGRADEPAEPPATRIRRQRRTAESPREVAAAMRGGTRRRAARHRHAQGRRAARSACCASRKSPGRNSPSDASDSRRSRRAGSTTTGDFSPEALRIAVINDCVQRSVRRHEALFAERASRRSRFRRARQVRGGERRASTSS